MAFRLETQSSCPLSLRDRAGVRVKTLWQQTIGELAHTPWIAEQPEAARGFPRSETSL